MSEVKVEQPKDVAMKKTSKTSSVPAMFDDFFSPNFPIARLFNLSPFSLMKDFKAEMGRAFSDMGGVPEAWIPTVDVRRCNGDLVVTAELPVLKKEDVKVAMADGSLTIEGERKQEHKEDHVGYHRIERNYGKFYRSIPLPDGARTDQATAELNNGVLKVSVPVPEAKQQSRQIPVHSSGA